MSRALNEIGDIGYKNYAIPSEPKDESSDVKISEPYSLWSSGDATVFYPVSKTYEKLPCGVYEFCIQDGMTKFVKIKYSIEDLLVFDGTIGEIVSDIEQFWERQDLFTEYDLTFKRGILLYGAPGCGKSCTIKLVVSDIIKRGGIAVKFTSPNSFIECMRVFRKLQPDTPVVVIMEDLDALMSDWPSRILNLLDGIDSFDKIVYLATTNYPEILEPRIKNRPSRFDRRYEIKTCSKDVRKKYLEHLISKSDKINIDIDQWVLDTKNMSFSHIKELFISVCLFKKDYQESLNILRDMSKKISSESHEGSGIGFRGDL